MSPTPIDMAKVTQMLDAGWDVRLYKGGLGSYVVETRHKNKVLVDRIRTKLREFGDVGLDYDEDDEITTDDFTPEQALTRAAYKCHGEILSVGEDE